MPEGKEVPAEQVLADIKQGLSDDQLMNKYGLSAPRLDLLFGKLMYSGLITKSELDARKPLARDTPATGTGVSSQNSLQPSPAEPPSGADSPGNIQLNGLRPSDATLRDYERKAFWGIVVSVLLGLVGAGLSQAGDAAKAVAPLISLIGFGLYLWGFYFLVKRKGYHWAWTFLCILSCIGLLLIVFMKDKYELPRSRYRTAIIAVIISIPVVLAVLGIILAISIPYYISFNRTACDSVARQELIRLQAAYDKYRNDPNNRAKEPPGDLGLLAGPYYGWTGTDEKCQVRIKYDWSSHEAAAVAMKGRHPQDASSRYVYRRNLTSGSEQTSTIPAVDSSEFTAYPLLAAGRGASCFDDEGTLRKECGGRHPADEATSLNTLAEKYRLQRKYAEAEPLYKRSLAIREKALGPEHPDVAQSLNNLGLLHFSQGKYSEAEPMLKRALWMRQTALDPEHLDVAQSLNNLGLLCASQKKYLEAEPLYKRSLEIREKTLGHEHPAVAQSLSNLAEMYRWQRKYSDAEPLYKRSLDIREKALGPEHPVVAASLHNLAEMYRLQRNYAEAEPLHKRSLEIREKKLGPEHLDVAQSLNNLALLYKSQKKYAEAEPLLKRSLSICEKKLGPNDPRLAKVLNNLAALYRKIGEEEEASKLEGRAQKIKSQSGSR